MGSYNRRECLGILGKNNSPEVLWKNWEIEVWIYVPEKRDADRFHNLLTRSVRYGRAWLKPDTPHGSVQTFFPLATMLCPVLPTVLGQALVQVF